MNPITRRAFLAALTRAGAACTVSLGLSGCANFLDDDSNVAVEFRHGVASGDPLSDAVIIWTRVTPASDAVLPVSWEVAEDEAFRRVVNNGTTETDAGMDYTVKIDIRNLNPATTYSQPITTVSFVTVRQLKRAAPGL